MKKLTLIATVAMLCPLTAKECLADYKDMASQVETVADFWLGGYTNDSQSSVNESLADVYHLEGAATRMGSQKATEFYSTKSSASGGLLVKAAPLPNRIHLEFDYYNDNDWFGDFRQSYKDYFQVRFLPRRFVHNLDNLAVFDFNPATRNYNSSVAYSPDPLDPSKGTTPYNTNGNDVERPDALVDNYSLKIDIDQYRLRLKTPDFPLHFYHEGEIVSRTGLQQMRFVGGTGTTSGSSTAVEGPGGPGSLPLVTPIATSRGRVRVTEARVIDQESKEFTFGANAHLGLFEIDLSNKTRKFENNVAAPTYNYEIASAGAVTGATINTSHNVIPELKATTNSLKIHTSHTGRIVASATYTEISKTNEYSGAKAENSMGYGELTWLPVGYLSMTTKVRHQKNDATAPESVGAYSRYGVWTKYLVNPGVASKTDTGSLAVRYSLVPKTNLNLIYTKKIKKIEEESAIAWSRPVKQTYDVFEAGFTNWVIPKVRITGKFSNTQVGTDFGEAPINNDPSRTNQGTLGFTWTITPSLFAFINASATKETTQDNRMGEISNASQADALREQYLASCSYRINDKVAITPTYTYMAYKQQRDMVFKTTAPTVVDSGYRNQQKAQNFALNLMVVPTKRLNINTTVDYTITKGTYDPTSPLMVAANVTSPFVSYDAEQLAMFSETHTEEINVRLDSEYDLGRGWGLGLDLRYVDWKDTSVDNPSNGTFVGGLFKVSKKLFY